MLGAGFSLAHRGARPPIPDPATERAVRAFLHHIEGRYPVRDIVLFGSRARDTHTFESDADLAVILSDSDNSDQRGDVSGEMAEIAIDVLMEVGLLVQAGTVDPALGRALNRMRDIRVRAGSLSGSPTIRGAEWAVSRAGSFVAAFREKFFEP